MCKSVAVVGPTASGKSGLAIEIAKEFSGEIISCDSMQIYKHMDIGTAKPTKEEMDLIPHHLVDFVDVGREYSVSDYVKDAERMVKELEGRGVLPVFCGGTGLYISSYISGISFGEYENDESVRQRLLEEVKESGVDALYERLCSVDKQAADGIEKNNVKRVVRALEIYETTGVTMTEWNRRSKINAKKKDCLVIGLDYKDRQLLYDRIDLRVDKMMECGLLEEAKMLYQMGALERGTAAQAIAYKELVPYIENKDTLENCVETLKRNSRRYSKRQLTWFRRNPDIKWIYKDETDDKAVVENAFKMIKGYLSEE